MTVTILTEAVSVHGFSGLAAGCNCKVWIWISRIRVVPATQPPTADRSV